MLLALVTQPPAQAAPSPGYVALGDSFAAGVGSRSYQGDDRCYRSPKSYPALVAERYALPLTLAACSGAVTADVVETQAWSLQSETRYVTVTIGGNDVGFSSVLTRCALPGWLGGCGPALDRGLRTLRGSLPGRLDEVLRTINRRSPRATVVVTGYPRLFGSEDCSALTFFSPAERARLNAATDELDALIEDRARAAGGRYVDPEPAFGSHAWCDHRSWVNGPSRPLLDAYHPNADGHAAYAGLVGPALVRSPGRTDPDAVRSVLLPPATGGEAAAAGGFVFAVPDLDGPGVTRASLAAGLTRTELKQFREARRAGDDRELDRLDATLTRRAAQRRADSGPR